MEPALQNIPLPTALGREIRRGFAARQPVLVSTDYARMERDVLKALRLRAMYGGRR